MVLYLELFFSVPEKLKHLHSLHITFLKYTIRQFLKKFNNIPSHLFFFILHIILHQIYALLWSVEIYRYSFTFIIKYWLQCYFVLHWFHKNNFSKNAKHLFPHWINWFISWLNKVQLRFYSISTQLYFLIFIRNNSMKNVFDMMHFIVPWKINFFVLTKAKSMTIKTFNISILPTDCFVLFLHCLPKKTTDLISWPISSMQVISEIKNLIG